MRSTANHRPGRERQRKKTLLTSLLIGLLLSSCCPTLRIGGQDEVIATVSALETQQSALATRIASNNELLSYLATRIPYTPMSELPDHATKTPFIPLEGRVEIEGGACCAGGIVGETIPLTISFYAFSQYAPVTEMRARLGLKPFSESELEEIAWEPYVSQRTYEVDVGNNWIGMYISFQFRDQQGNLSLVYVDDIGVEGHPASPTPE